MSIMNVRVRSVPIREDMSPLELAVVQVTSRSHLYEILPAFAEQTAQIFENVREKGLRDNLPMDLDTEKELRKQVIQESLQRLLVEEVNKVYRKEDGTTSKQPLLLAHPSGYQERVNADLNVLESDMLAQFMTADWAVQDNFLPV